MRNNFIIKGYGTNKRGLTVGTTYRTHSDSAESAKAAAMIQAQHAGLSYIRITRVQEVAA